MNNLLPSGFTLKSYTFLLLATSLLGTNIVNLNVVFFQLSPYRLLLLLSPFLLFKVKKRIILSHKQGINYAYFMFMFFWVVYSILPLLWVEDFYEWAKLYSFLLSALVITWFIGWYLTAKEDIIKAMKIVEFFAIGLGFLAIYEITSGNYLFVSEISLGYYQERSLLESTIGYRVPISIFGNPNDYALFLLFAVFNSIGLSKVRKTRSNRLLSFAFSFFFIFLLFATQSRSAFIGLLLGIMAFYLVKLKHTSSKNLFKLFFGVLAALLLVIPWLIENNELFVALITFDTTTGSDEVRLNLLKNGVDFLVSSFFMGVGLGNIEYYMSNYGIYPTYGVTNIHNFWMEILVSSGIFVFFFYFIIYFINIFRLYRYSLTHSDKEMRFLSKIFFCFLLAFFITSTGASSLIYNEWIWPIIALIMSFINIRSKSLLE